MHTKFLHKFYASLADPTTRNGILTIVCIQKETKRIKTVRTPLMDLACFDWGEIIQLNNEKYDIYFGAALRTPDLLKKRKSMRGGIADCVVSTALSVDIDFASEKAHVSDHLPTENDLPGILKNGPDPSIVIHSGYGHHWHFLYNEPALLRNQSGRTQYNAYRKRCHSAYERYHRENDWTWESTHSLDRIWRLPGFSNWKIPDHPVPVTVEYESDATYNQADLIPASPAPTQIPAIQTASNTIVYTGLSKREADEKERTLENIRDTLQGIAERYTEEADQAYLLEKDIVKRDDLLKRAFYIEQLLKGNSIEEKGKRDQALTVVCGIVCHALPEIKEFTEEDFRILLDGLFLPSLTKWCEDNEDTDLFREFGKTIDKLQRFKSADTQRQKPIDALRNSIADYRLQKEQEQQALQETEKPTKAPQETISDEDLLKAGIILHKSFYYIYDWTRKRYFPRGLKRDEVFLVLRDCWVGDDCPFHYRILNEENQYTNLPLDYILDHYGTGAADAYYTFEKQKTVFDHQTSTFCIAPRPWRETEPAYNSEIDTWLKKLGGYNYNLLCDWLAALTQLDKPCAALYLNGPPGCGKTLFAHGAAQLWNTRASIYEESVGQYNEDLLQCPVLLVDEGFYGTTVRNPATVLKRLVASDSHKTNIKYGAKIPLKGHVRIVIAANDDSVLLSGKEEQLSQDSAKALKERIAYVKIRGNEARDYLIQNNDDRGLTDQWIRGGLFAKHVLWLAENRELKQKGRFLIVGADSDMHKQMLFQGNERNEVLEWLVRFAEAPNNINARVPNGKPRAACIGNGIVAVNTKLARESWSEYSYNTETMTHSHLLRHLKTIALQENAIQVLISDSDNKKARYWPIPIGTLVSYADSHDIGDIETIIQNAEQTSPITDSIVTSKFYYP